MRWQYLKFRRTFMVIMLFLRDILYESVAHRSTHAYESHKLVFLFLTKFIFCLFAFQLFVDNAGSLYLFIIEWNEIKVFFDEIFSFFSLLFLTKKRGLAITKKKTFRYILPVYLHFDFGLRQQICVFLKATQAFLHFVIAKHIGVSKKKKTESAFVHFFFSLHYAFFTAFSFFYFWKIKNQ